MEPLLRLCVPCCLIRNGSQNAKKAYGRTEYGIEEVGPERVAELFQNYEQALGVCGKGSESGSCQESAHPHKNRMTAPTDLDLQSAESREYFAQPGEAEWGC